MTTAALLSSNHCVGLGRRALRQLRESLERDTGLQAATYLQEAGFAGGEELYSTYAAWLDRTAGIAEPGALDADRLGEMLSRFFSETGWGSLSVDRMGDAVLALDSSDWAEAAGAAGAPQTPMTHTSGQQHTARDQREQRTGWCLQTAQAVHCRSHQVQERAGPEHQRKGGRQQVPQERGC